MRFPRHGRRNRTRRRSASGAGGRGADGCPVTALRSRTGAGSLTNPRGWRPIRGAGIYISVMQDRVSNLTERIGGFVLADLREALRQLRKAPGVTTTAVLTLALGIGATTAIFTLVHQVMLKSLPVTKPEELWRIGDKVRCCNWGGYTQDNDGDFALFSYEAFRNFQDHTPEFLDLTVLQAGNTALGVRRAGSQAPVDTRNGEYVSGNFFRTLDVQPWIGRLMTDDDDRQGAPPVAVMSYHVWTDKYGADPSVVGAGYEINGH